MSDPAKDNLRLLSPGAEAARRLEAATKLTALAQDWAKGLLTEDAYGYVVILVGRQDCPVTWHGLRTWDEIEEADIAFRATRRAMQFGEDDPVEARQRERKLRQDWKARQVAQQREYLLQHPFQCPFAHCQDRFKTYRGVRQHEAKKQPHFYHEKAGNLLEHHTGRLKPISFVDPFMLRPVLREPEDAER